MPGFDELVRGKPDVITLDITKFIQLFLIL